MTTYRAIAPVLLSIVLASTACATVGETKPSRGLVEDPGNSGKVNLDDCTLFTTQATKAKAWLCETNDASEGVEKRKCILRWVRCGREWQPCLVSIVNPCQNICVCP